MLDLKNIAYPLPEDVENARRSGCYEMANILIDRYLASSLTPKQTKDRLLLERHNMEIVKKAFPYTIEEADDLLSRNFPGRYIKGSISKGLIDGDLAWTMIDGKMMVEKRVVADASRRLPMRVEDHATNTDIQKRDSNVAFMKENGTRQARIRLRATVKPLSGFGEKVRVNIPVVRPSHSISDICFVEASAGYIGVDSENVLMRSAQFERVLEEGDVFFIEYEYTITAHYREIKKTSTPIDRKAYAEYLEEQRPHILFTPFLKDLASDITKSIDSPSEKARAIYNWITTHVNYSFMRPYKTIENIPEYAAVNLKGDCGVQAMLFITLCRIAGIPAKWQSGLYVTEKEASCHDWAEFYLPEYGWCFADCSFGGGAFRQGKEERWHYYFGSDDVFRMPANDACCLKLSRKEQYSADPTDNQRGEVETDEKNLEDDEVEKETKVISFTYLGE